MSGLTIQRDSEFVNTCDRSHLLQVVQASIPQKRSPTHPRTFCFLQPTPKTQRRPIYCRSQGSYRILDFKLSPCSVCCIFFFWVIPRRLNCICRRFGTLCSIFIRKKLNNELLFTFLPMKMEQCSETSAYTIQKSGNYPEENIQATESHTKEVARGHYS
jgi:hypothetical protein